MYRFLLLATFAVVGLAPAALGSNAARVQAGWSELWASWKVDYRRNNCWPEPFVHADRQAMRAPWEIMKNNGWRMNNTIHDHLFNDRHELTRAGVLKIHWIATQAVEPRRVVFVLIGPDQEATERRLDAVQRAVANAVPEGSLPQVLLTTKVPRTGAGDYFDQIDRKAREAIPAPILPPMSNEEGGN